MVKVIKNGEEINVTLKNIKPYLNVITNRLKLTHLAMYPIYNKVMNHTFDGIEYKEFRDFFAKTANDLILTDPGYALIAGNILIDNIYQNNNKSLLWVTEELHKDGTLKEDYYQFVLANHEKLQAMLIFDNDYIFDYRSLMQYFQMYAGKDQYFNPIETPQLTFIRVATNLFMNYNPFAHMPNDNKENVIRVYPVDMRDYIFDKIKETYMAMSERKYTHASPTIIGSGFKYMASASCFMFEVQDEIKEDNVNGIFDAEKEIALNNKYMGGNGIYAGRIRSAGTRIKSINGGKASGIIPYLKGFAQVNHSVSQANKRPGVTAVFLDIWHPDIKQFCNLRMPGGDEQLRARNLNIGVMIPDLFMRRLENDEMFSLMDPCDCPGLNDVFGKEFDELYLRYESEGKQRSQIKARDLFEHYLLPSMNKTGEPYIMFRDHINDKSMLSHKCTINSSNLCCECTLFVGPEGTGVCILSSVCLASCLNEGKFDFDELMRITRLVTRNLNILIDINHYPTTKSRNTSLNSRSIGIGVQGLADVFMMLRIAYDSPEATLLNKQIFEAMYYAAVDESIELARLHGPYPWYENSPHSKGLLQFDLWKNSEFTLFTSDDWNRLKLKMKQYGIRNSLLTAMMPTASSSIFMGFNESFEPFNSNIYKKNNITGENIICNKYMIKHLQELGLWDPEMKDMIIENKGNLPDCIPEEVRNIYKTVYQLGNKPVIKLCADRGPFVDQSQSMNIYFDAPNNEKVYMSIKYAWSLGLKTGSYYTKTKVSNVEMKLSTECISCQ